MTRSKRDGNERAILADLHRLGVWYCQMEREAGFDLLLGFRGRLCVVEIKDSAQPPNKRRLTANELQRVVELGLVDVPYYRCETLAEVLAALEAA